MFIELTDHLRCPADHPEAFLVLLPDLMAGRRVAAGSLGCLVCGRVFPVADGVVDFGGDPPATRPTALSAAAIATVLGLDGPGGYLALFGEVGGLASDLAALAPGIRMVLINPPAGVADSEVGSVLRAGRSPLKSRSMRGVVLSEDHGAVPEWAEAAIEAVLPGNRLMVEGPRVGRAGLEILAETGRIWVARTATTAFR